MKIYLGSDNKITVTVTDEDGDAVPGATVTLTLVDLEGDEISGATWPVTVSAVSSGVYSVVLPSTLSVTANQRLKCKVWADSGSWDAYAEIPTQVAVDRT